MLLTKSCMGPSLHLPRQTTTLYPIVRRIALPAFLAIFCHFSKLNAQFYRPSAISKEVGDTLPTSFFETIHQAVNAKTGEATTIKLADYRHKLIILDFWATWCKPCIGSLNKLDSIARDWQDDRYVVIPVTDQNAAQAEPGFKKFRWNMTSIVADTLLAQIFPHSGIPHQVWIKDGKVLAIPQHQYATAENIKKVINGETVDLKPSLTSYDVSRPLYNDGNGGGKEQILYQSTIGKANPAFAQQRMRFTKRPDFNLLMMANVPLDFLYYEAFKQDIHPGLYKELGLCIELDDSLRTLAFPDSPQIQDFPNLKAFQSQKEDFVASHWYSYSLMVPKNTEELTARKKMQQDLNNYFGGRLGIEGVIKNKLCTFLILERLASYTNSLIASKGGERKIELSGKEQYILENCEFFNLISSPILRTVFPTAVFLDDTGINANAIKIDITLPKSIQNNITLANQELARYGLHLRKEIRNIPVLIIRSKQLKEPELVFNP